MGHQLLKRTGKVPSTLDLAQIDLSQYYEVRIKRLDKSLQIVYKPIFAICLEPSPPSMARGIFLHSGMSVKILAPSLMNRLISNQPFRWSADVTSFPQKTLLSWCLYDWANSAFATVILAAVLPVYFVSLVPEGGAGLPLFGEHRFSAASLWGYAVSGSMLILALAAPLLGAHADRHARHKRMMLIFCLFGCTATALLALPGPGNYLWMVLIFMVANFAFAGANIFYNAYLTVLVPPAMSDRLSARGFAWGYLGGGLFLALSFVIILAYPRFGFTDAAAATRFSFVLTALWWLLFALPAFYYLPVAAHPASGSPRFSFRGWLKQFQQLLHYRDLSLFLLAFLCYNDGIQTIISVSAVFARDELGLSRTTIIGCLLMIQFVAMPGALFFARLSARFGALRAILCSLVIFLLVCLYAYRISTAVEFWILGGVIALVLGGSQALSRALFSTMVPSHKSAEFFGFYTISSRFAAIAGPLVFALVTDVSGSARNAILAVGLFFLLGGILLLGVNVERGRAQASR